MVLFISVILGASVSYGAETFPFLGEIVKDRVNIRAGQNVNFEKLGLLKKGQEVIVIGQNYGWYKIQLPLGAESFVSSSYLQKEADDMGIAAGNRLNVRAGAGANFVVIGQLHKGQRVRILSLANGWYKIEPVDGIFGWLLEEFVRFKSNQIPPGHITQVANYGNREEDSLVPAQQKIEAAAPQSPAPPQKEETPLIVVGWLENLSEEQVNGELRYKLTEENGPIYYLKGPSQIMHDFLYYKVKVEGQSSPVPANLSAPGVMAVSKIHLIL